MCKAGRNGNLIAQQLRVDYPYPEMQIDGYLMDIPLNIRQAHSSDLLNQFGLGYKTDLLCCWYWTADEWQTLVNTYQSLPDVWDDFYMKYDPEPNDRMLLVPMSSKSKQGSGGKVQVNFRTVDTVDKTVDKSDTNQAEKVQVSIFGRR
jgi:hypothetical protein